jgi:hypothetical protein
MGCCGEHKPTSGIASLAKAFIGPKAELAEIDARLTICLECQNVDSSGKRLLRVARGFLWCGEPRFSKILRVESTDGCGCVITSKVRYKDAHCPLGKW